MTAVRNHRAEINRRDAECAELILCVLCASVVKSISDFRVLISVLCAMLLALSFPADAQQPKNVPRIGFLGFTSLSGIAARIEAFRQGLRELGYVEGKDIAIEYRAAEGKLDRLPALAAELVRLKVDVVFAPSTNLALVAKNATKTIPIVFVGSGDPVAAGLVDSLARPGGNITGFTRIGTVLVGKRLELLKETIPKLSRVALMWNPQDPGSRQEWKES